MLLSPASKNDILSSSMLSESGGSKTPRQYDNQSVLVRIKKRHTSGIYGIGLKVKVLCVPSLAEILGILLAIFLVFVL